MVSRAMIVVAAGAGSRYGGNKLMEPLLGIPLVAHAVAAASASTDRCVLVCRADLVEEAQGLDLGVEIVSGGATRTASEMAGLAALGGEVGLIGIHDGARPLLSAGLIERLFEAAGEYGGAIPVLDPVRPIVHRGSLTPVENVRTIQTPQVFAGDILMTAYVKAARAGYEGHDTADVVQRFTKQAIVAVPGDPDNIKVTYPSDMKRVRDVLETRFS